MSFTLKFLMLVTCSVLAISRLALGMEIEIVQPTRVVQKSPNGLVKVGQAEPGEQFLLLGQTSDKRWYIIQYLDRKAAIPAEDARIVGEGRRVSSLIEEDVVVKDIPKSQWSIEPIVGWQTHALGFAAGLGFNYHSPWSILSGTRLDFGLHGLFFLSPENAEGSVDTSTASTSTSAFQILASGRMLYPVDPKMSVGAEAGFGLTRASATVSVTVPSTGGTSPAASSSSTTLGILLGGIASYQFADNWHANGRLRFLVSSDAVMQMVLGVEYNF